MTVENCLRSGAICWHYESVTSRFLTLSDVANILNVAPAQVYTLVRSGELPAIKIGARGQWRVEAQVVEKFIADMYRTTEVFVQTHPRTPSL